MTMLLRTVRSFATVAVAVGTYASFRNHDLRRLNSSTGLGKTRWNPPAGWSTTNIAFCETVGDEVELVPGINYHDQIDGVMKFVGAGMRRMTPLKIKVYAIGLYMKEAVMSKVLNPWKGKTAAEVLPDEQFWRTVCSPDVEKTLVMIIAREVTGKHIQQGFDRAMLKRIRALEKQGEVGGKLALKKMNTAIANLGKLPEGNEIRFEFGGAGMLIVRMPNGTSVEIISSALCIALAEMFLGERAASPEAKLAFANGFERLLPIAEDEGVDPVLDTVTLPPLA